MERPLEIGFHNMQSSESLEAEIRERVARLEQRFPHMIGCRVSVEALHRQHRTGNIFEAHVVVSVKDRDLAASREPHHAKERFTNPDIRVSLREAFAAAERQLQDHAGKRRAESRQPNKTVAE
jgi:ribosome-associated translation inhibitor RaiA